MTSGLVSKMLCSICRRHTKCLLIFVTLATRPWSSMLSPAVSQQSWDICYLWLVMHLMTDARRHSYFNHLLHVITWWKLGRFAWNWYSSFSYYITQMHVIALSPWTVAIEVKRYQNTILGTSGHQCSICCVLLTRYDFQLVLYGDIRSVWSCSWVISTHMMHHRAWYLKKMLSYTNWK